MRERGYVVEPPATITDNPIPPPRVGAFLALSKNQVAHSKKTRVWQAEPAGTSNIVSMSNSNPKHNGKERKEHREPDCSRELQQPYTDSNVGARCREVREVEVESQHGIPHIQGGVRGVHPRRGYRSVHQDEDKRDVEVRWHHERNTRRCQRGHCDVALDAHLSRSRQGRFV